MRFYAYLLALLLLSGCGGFRGGIESVPYVGEAVPLGSASLRTALREIPLSGMTVAVSLNNGLQTYQYEVMLYVIPTYLNFRDEFQHRDAKNLELTLQITAHNSGVTIDPRQLVLAVDGKELRPTAIWVNNREQERQVIDTYVAARQQAPSDHPPPVPRAAEWRTRVTAPAMVLPHEKSPRFIVVLPLQLVPPQRELSLNVNPAIVEPAGSDHSLIRFMPQRWSEGYS